MMTNFSCMSELYIHHFILSVDCTKLLFCVLEDVSIDPSNA